MKKNKFSWKTEIKLILEELGGKASLSEIYEAVVSRGNINSLPDSWHSRVRDNLQKFSSDSKTFSGKEDIFYSVHGIRSGVWGLRSHIGKTPYASDVKKPEKADRVSQTVYRILRDTSLSRLIKAMYDFECQICGDVIEISEGRRYAEGHHVKPLGTPHDGPDIKENIICLCPNCHAKMDYGAIKLSLDKIRFCDKHILNQEYVDYHNQHIFGCH